MKLRPFELALVVGFVVLMIAALLLFRGGSWTGDDEPTGPQLTAPVTVWGTFPAGPISRLITELQAANENLGTIQYREISPAVFDQTLVEALAEGRGPDAIIVSHERLVEHQGKIQPFSLEAIPPDSLRRNYVDSVSIWRQPAGWYGLPLAVDPLVLYSNRRLLTQANFLQPAATWETLISSHFPALIERDFNRNINRSVVAMGESTNVSHTHAILSTLASQAGSQGVVTGSQGYEIRLNQGAGGGQPLTEAFAFYTRFSNTANTLYSWNRALPNDQTQFIREDLVYYFGFGSEVNTIRQQNPNLDFDISLVPQGAAATNRSTYGRVYAVSLLRSSYNLGNAATVANLLASNLANGARIARDAAMAPVARATLAAGSSDPTEVVRFNSAPVVFVWPNPSPAAMDNLYSTTLSEINSQRSTVGGAVGDWLERLERLY